MCESQLPDLFLQNIQPKITAVHQGNNSRQMSAEESICASGRIVIVGQDDKRQLATLAFKFDKFPAAAKIINTQVF